MMKKNYGAMVVELLSALLYMGLVAMGGLVVFVLAVGC